MFANCLCSKNFLPNEHRISRTEHDPQTSCSCPVLLYMTNDQWPMTIHWNNWSAMCILYIVLNMVSVSFLLFHFKASIHSIHRPPIQFPWKKMPTKNQHNEVHTESNLNSEHTYTNHRAPHVDGLNTINFIAIAIVIDLFYTWLNGRGTQTQHQRKNTQNNWKETKYEMKWSLLGSVSYVDPFHSDVST